MSGNQYTLAERLVRISMDGGAKRTDGNVEHEHGWFCLIEDVDDQDHILRRDNEGFYTVEQFDHIEIDADHGGYYSPAEVRYNELVQLSSRPHVRAIMAEVAVASIVRTERFQQFTVNHRDMPDGFYWVRYNEDQDALIWWGPCPSPIAALTAWDVNSSPTEDDMIVLFSSGEYDHIGEANALHDEVMAYHDQHQQ